MYTARWDMQRMAQTFEELASGELDALYQGALFLSGGSAPGAERLLVDAVTLAFQEHAAETDAESVQRWLEARLVRAYLRAVDGAVTPQEVLRERPAIGPEALRDLGAEELFSAAAILPPQSRAAVWLVLFRRWSYNDAAHALGIEPGAMPDLLRYRDALIGELMSSRTSRSTRPEAM